MNILWYQKSPPRSRLIMRILFTRSKMDIPPVMLLISTISIITRGNRPFPEWCIRLVHAPVDCLLLILQRPLSQLQDLDTCLSILSSRPTARLAFNPDESTFPSKPSLEINPRTLYHHILKREICWKSLTHLLSTSAVVLVP
jgi:hypothetical protein